MRVVPPNYTPNEIRGLITICHYFSRPLFPQMMWSSVARVSSLLKPHLKVALKWSDCVPCQRRVRGGNRSASGRGKRRGTKRSFRASISDLASSFPHSFPPFNHLTSASRAANPRIQFSIQNVMCWSPAKWSHYSKKRKYLLDEILWAFTSNFA